MNVTHILNKTLSFVTPNMHRRRKQSLAVSVGIIIQGNAANVTSIGRGIKSSAKEKHNIKRADRLLSNYHLQSETKGIYQALAKLTVGQCLRPIILIDWSDLDEYKRNFLIRATLASHGRGLCIYEEVHSIKTKEKPATHTTFMARLEDILPNNCQPIIVTDAGFKTPWFRTVLARGWDFVGRVRLPNFYSTDNQNWQSITQLYAKATTCPKSFTGRIARSNPLDCQLVIYKQNPKGRKALNRSGKPKQSKHAKVHIKSARDPWLLATSLPQGHQLEKRLVKIYRLRMQIEEGFRDMKSRQYGLGLEHNKTKQINRLSILILLTTLAHWVLMNLGMMAKLANKHRQYQANSIKTSNVLSLHFIGRRVAIDKHFTLGIKNYLIAIKQFQISNGVLISELL